LTQSKRPVLIDGDGCSLLYDPELLDRPPAVFLSRDIFDQALSCQQITQSGRGQAWFIELTGLSTVLRSYRRGGLVAKFNRQTYVGWSAKGSRAYKEWRLLSHLGNLGLPVPRPIAASFCRGLSGIAPFYRARILVRRIPNVQTFDYLLSAAPLDAVVWQSVGTCIRRFHDQGIYHADLNANNILLDDQQLVYLIDFDKGEIRKEKQQEAQWKLDNLQRLKRSLLKQQALREEYAFSEENWDSLVNAYKAA
jgi:3-deoxy-D-manno-octulosonic acid kinase